MKLLVLRGAPGVGKTTLSYELKTLLNREGKKVSLFHWDDTLLKYDIVEKLDKEIILNVTKLLLDQVKSVSNNLNPDFVIIDGVFVYEEEIKLINMLKQSFSNIYYGKLECLFSTQNYRNENRDPYGVLPRERLVEVNRDFEKNIFSINNQIILNTEEEIGITANRIVKFIKQDDCFT